MTKKFSAVFTILILAGALFYFFKPQVQKELIWEKGYSYFYSFNYHSQNKSELSLNLSNASADEKQSFEGEFNIDSELVLSSAGKQENGKNMLSAKFSNIKKCEALILSQSLFKEESCEKIFDSSYFYLVMGDDGKVEKVLFPSETKKAYKYLVINIINDIQFEIDKTASKWSKEEKNSNGTSVVKYSDSFFKNGFSKTREKYTNLKIFLGEQVDFNQKIEGTYEYAVLKNGCLSSINGHEKLSAGKEKKSSLEYSTAVSLNFLKKEESRDKFGETSLVAVAGKNLFSYIPGENISSEGSERRSLILQAGTINFDAIKDWVGNIKNEKNDKDISMFKKAVAYLKLHPEKAKEIESLFYDENLSIDGKGSVLDILTGAGNDSCQNSLISIIKSDEAKKSPAYIRFVQAFSFVESPTQAASDFLTTIINNESEDPAIRNAVAYSIGSMSSNIKKTGNSGEAEKLSDLLVAKLETAETPKEQAALLTGLGNAGIEKNIEKIAPFSQSANPELRNSAANALRKTQTEESEKMLLKLARDNDGSVQAKALESMTQYKLENKHFTELQKSVSEKVIKEENYINTINLISSKNSDKETLKKMLNSMVQNNIKDPDIARYINNYLNEISGQY